MYYSLKEVRQEYDFNVKSMLFHMAFFILYLIANIIYVIYSVRFEKQISVCDNSECRTPEFWYKVYLDTRNRSDA